MSTRPGWTLQAALTTTGCARGKNLRQNMRKQRNKLAAEGTTHPCCAVLRGMCKTWRRRWHATERIESAGWKASQGTAIHADNEQGRFYKQLFEAAGKLRARPYSSNICSTTRQRRSTCACCAHGVLGGAEDHL
jgi:hypothetical protein